IRDFHVTGVQTCALPILLLQAAGLPADEIASSLNYVAYSGGGESLAALLGDNVDAGISGVGEYVEQIEAGELRALAVSGEDRVRSEERRVGRGRGAGGGA